MSYFISILIFYIILKASVKIAIVFLNNKGRLEKTKNYNSVKKPRSISLLIIACVPILRSIFILAIYFICFCNEENFNKIIGK